MDFYVLIGGQRKGPFTLEQLAGQGLERDTPVWHKGLQDWARADTLPALGELMLTIPPPAPPAPTALPVLPDGRVSFASWVRYQPRTFKVLYGWFLLLTCFALTAAVAAPVLFVASAGKRPVRIEQGQLVPDVAALQRAETLQIVGAVTVILGSLALIAAVALFVVQIYKAWNQIQDGHPLTSAERAVGFLFIPFFNLYWLFVAVYGLAWEVHHAVVRRRLFPRLGPFPVSPGLALCCSIVMIGNVIPIVDFVTIPVSLVLLLILMNSVKHASMGIAADRLQEGVAQAWAPPPVSPPTAEKSEQVRHLEIG
jgi:hypothetical protein